MAAICAGCTERKVWRVPVFEVCMLWDGHATLGEGPVWDPSRGVLWFVDIKQRKVHCFNPCTREVDHWDAPAQIGWVLPASDGMLFAGLQTGLAKLDIESGAFISLTEVEPEFPSNRLNDATTGADGSIWFGSMDNEETEATGRFYRWNGAKIAPVELDPVCITNGPALSPDQRTLYHVDTAGGIVYASQLNAEGNVISTHEFARIDPVDGHPDGCSVDTQGNVWLGLWGGWRARLYAPDGKIIREVRLPVSNVTKVALGGKDMTTAYVTTARAGLSEEELAQQPDAGNLFAFKVNVPGIPTPSARG